MVTAVIKALRDEMGDAAKSMSKHASKAPQNPVWGVPKPFEIEAWGDPGPKNAALKRPRAVKSGQEVPKRHPRRIRERPGAVQERAKVGQVTPKRVPNFSRIDT